MSVYIEVHVIAWVKIQKLSVSSVNIKSAAFHTILAVNSVYRRIYDHKGQHSVIL